MANRGSYNGGGSRGRVDPVAQYSARMGVNTSPMDAARRIRLEAQWKAIQDAMEKEQASQNDKLGKQWGK